MSMATEQTKNAEPRLSLAAEIASVWRELPNRALLLGLLGAWVALFHFLGNSTLGYVNTPSLFGWWTWTMSMTPDEEHAWLIPFAVVGLLWARREEVLKLDLKAWWPALFVLLFAMLLHVGGYMIQQSRLSVAAFFLGIYALIGLMWGRKWMWAALFPFSLFVFCVPMGAGATEIVTFPLRMLATQITAILCNTILGINVVQNGTQLYDAAGSYQYEVAAACSGIRSLTAILAFSVIYAYISFKMTWRRLSMVAAAFPLAVVANVFRLVLIVIAAEAFGQNAGNYVHESTLFSLVPYLPALAGIFAFGWWLSEDKKSPQPILVPAEQPL